MLLYRLAYQLTGDVHESVVSVYIYCLSPASIFFSALYSEPFYFHLTLTGLLLLFGTERQGGRERELAAAGVFALAFLTRANGLLNLGYVLWVLVAEAAVREVKDDERGSRWLALEESWGGFGRKVCII